MLTADQTAIIKATVPILETGGEALTTHFYKIMLSEYPQVRPLFNQAHQASGAQPRALANGVLMYAKHIDQLHELGNLAAQIVNKHVSLQVLPEHYPIVGACLLRAIREVLGPETATDAVIDAWAAAYRQLADVLIGAEKDVTTSSPQPPAGGAAPVKESAEIISFYLEPVDGRKVVDFVPGQYLGLRLEIGGQEVRRNYSLSAAANGRGYRISVKRENGGLASNFLHDCIEPSSVLDVFPPSGEFTLRDGTSPLVLISGGVGITPTLAMAEAALAEGKRDVTFLHYTRNREVHAFAETLAGWAARYPQLRHFIVYEHGEATDGGHAHAFGRPAISHLQHSLPANLDCDVYFLGPKPFMAFIKRSLAALGLPGHRAYYEFFGPAEALD
ncbi:hypothetical protein Dimus_029191 [Dionaea muscipula]